MRPNSEIDYFEYLAVLLRQQMGALSLQVDACSDWRHTESV